LTRAAGSSVGAGASWTSGDRADPSGSIWTAALNSRCNFAAVFRASTSARRHRRASSPTPAAAACTVSCSQGETGLFQQFHQFRIGAVDALAARGIKVVGVQHEVAQKVGDVARAGACGSGCSTAVKASEAAMKTGSPPEASLQALCSVLCRIACRPESGATQGSASGIVNRAAPGSGKLGAVLGST
jgi:hypothetical protein